MNKRKRLIVACLALVLIITAWWFGASTMPGAIPVTLLGYTNDVTGIFTVIYDATNVAHSGFAVFRTHNPTRHDFLCYVGPVIAGGQSNRMQHAQTGDFTLPAGASITFAVPAPDIRGNWQCGLYLFRRQHLSRLRYECLRLAQRCGLYDFDKPSFTVSPEIER
ncbi:MAG: hypothetical protein JWP08_86 [Bryobacterales bacterium]|nr:hypothetical protein [Bryobacterales bacterium]